MMRRFLRESVGSKTLVLVAEEGLRVRAGLEASSAGDFAQVTTLHGAKRAGQAPYAYGGGGRGHLPLVVRWFLGGR